MKKRRLLKRALAVCVAASCIGTGVHFPALAEQLLPYRDEALSAEERALDLVSRMTSEEKYSQLRAQVAPAISRLGIKAYDWWSEGLHGVARDGRATSFPTGLGIAATWDPDLVKEMTTVMSDEAREKYNSGQNDHGLNYWSPTINMDRDPRWGRAEETYGEDPYLTAQIAEAFVNGYQGDTDTYKTIATAKHFLGNNSEQNRHNGSSNIDERDLHEYYTRAFKDIVEDGGVGAIMTSYNAVNGVPMSVNEPIVDDLLRRTWGFGGFVVTDCGALQDIVANHQWRPEGWGDKEWGGKETSAYAIKAGVDLNCGDVLPNNTGAAVNAGMLSEDEVDRALVRLFTARMKTGEFDAGGGEYGGAQFQGGIESDEHAQLAEKSADNAVVLLENKDNILPLTEDKTNIVLVGGLADELNLGDYSTYEPVRAITPKDGIEAALKRRNPNAEFTYIEDGNRGGAQYMMNTRGPKLLDADGNVLGQIDLTENSETHDCVIENDPANIGYTSQGCWVKFDAGVIDFTNVAKFSVEMSGASWIANPTRLEIRAEDPKNGPLLGMVDSENTSDWSDFRTFTFDATLGGGYTDKPIYIVLNAVGAKSGFTDEDKEKIEQADAVIYFAGTRSGENGYHEESDGANLNLPNGQSDDINEVAAMNGNVIVYMQAVSQINIEPFKDNVKGILWSTYNGQAQGNAAGRILFGEANPSAKLPFTWYTDVNELADIKDYTIRAEDEGNGRGYQYFKGGVTYPFGYGKSYSSYEYSNIAVDKTDVTPNDTVTVTFDVKNTSTVDGSEAAELYVVSPDAAEKGRPVKRLEGFEKKAIAAGTTEHYTITLSVEDLWYWDSENNVQCYDDGEYTIQVGPDSQNTPLTATFTLSGSLTPKLHAVTAVPSGHILTDGKSITTELTASKSDQSFIDLAADGVTVSYISSNDAVASVDENGTVTCGGETGIATITASVTVNGVTKSDSFPVKVPDGTEILPPPADSGNPPESFDFTTADKTALRNLWSVTNEDANAWTLDDNGLTINTQSGDLYQESGSYKNLFSQSAAGNWTIVTEVSLAHAPNEMYQQAAVMAFEDDNNYVKLSYENGWSGTYVQLGTEGSAVFNSIKMENIDTDKLYFRLEREGHVYKAAYSTDNSAWHDMGTVTQELSNVKFGLLAQNGDMDASSLAVTFKNVMVDGKGAVTPTVTPTSEPTAAPTTEPTAAPTTEPTAAPTQAPVEQRPVYITHGNPYIPIWDYTPDVEPYVFEDPDNPGKYRLYVYGSHDMLKTEFCGTDFVGWSAPVEDLSQWRYEGKIFECYVNGEADVLYAPDVQEYVDENGKKTYYLYPNDNSQGQRRAMVCKSDRPDGPFEVINWKDDKHDAVNGAVGFDPAVLFDNGEVYGYWGAAFPYEGGDYGSYWAKLDPDNKATLKSGETVHKNIPTRDQINDANYNPAEYNIVQDENTDKWGFFEASSIRKVGNKYVFIFSRNGLDSEPEGRNYSQLAYGYSDSPAGPWKWGGILIDALGEVIPNGDGTYSRTLGAPNTHGSIEEVNGQWYVFYHRGLNQFARQAMVEGIDVSWDEKPVSEGGKVTISRADETSQGFSINGLDPYEKYSAGIASYMTGGCSIAPEYEANADMPLLGMKGGAVAGWKHFDFDKNAPSGKSTTLELTLLPKAAVGTMDVYMRPKSAVNTPVEKDADGHITSVGEGSKKIASVEFTEKTYNVMTKVRIPASAVDELDGEWGLFLAGNSASTADLCDIYSIEFVADNEPLDNVVFKPLEKVYDSVDKQYLTSNHCISTEGSGGDQTNASLGGTEQIVLYSSHARLVIENDKLPLAEMFRVSYATSGGNMKMKLSAAETPDGAAEEICSFDIDGVGDYVTRLSDIASADKEKLAGKKYLIVEIDCSGNWYLDYIELLKDTEPEDDAELPDTVSVKTENGKIIVTSGYTADSGCDMYTAVYDTAGRLEAVKRNEAECSFDAAAGSHTVRVFFWNGMTPVFDPVVQAVSL